MKVTDKQGQLPISEARKKMVGTLQAYGIKDSNVLLAMQDTPRHLFIPDGEKKITFAYGDHPCDIGYSQTISQPYMVAYMSEILRIKKGDKVLEIGTGSGYQAAILARLGATVYSVEIEPALAERAAQFLIVTGYENIHVKKGDGHCGWPEHRPYQAIIATCAPQEIPPSLLDQLDEGGVFVLPLGEMNQRLVVIYKKNGEIIRENNLPVRFVPMVKKNPL